MKLFLVTSFTCLFLINFVEGQSFHSETDITWSDSRPLTWKDFVGTIDNKSFGIALTASSIICKPYFINDSIMLWIETIFISDHSWKKRPDLDSFDLAHEQTHFNITELFSRRLRLIIDGTLKPEKYINTSDLLFKIDSSLTILSIECEKMQNLYDKETNHSMNRAEQIKWNYSICKDLERLKKWTTNSFFIRKLTIYKD